MMLRSHYREDQEGQSVVKIPKDTGRRENLAGLALWILFIILYYCAISLIFRGSVFPENTGPSVSILPGPGTVCICVVSVIAGLLTARPLFHIYLRLKAYRAYEGPGWEDWRKRKEKTPPSISPRSRSDERHGREEP